ncbi:unnamed protein product, partial [Musa acuminata subsp. burmannicoides]
GRPRAASRKNRLPKGSESSDLHAAARNGTSPRSSPSATLIPRRQYSRSPFPDTVSFLLVLLSSIFAFVVVIMWWALRLVQNLSSEQLIAPPSLALSFKSPLSSVATLHNRLAPRVSQVDPFDA